jgi:predicted metalloprotease
VAGGAVIVAPVSQQQWGGPYPYASQGFRQPSFGPGPVYGGQPGPIPTYPPPGYGLPPNMPAPRRRSPLKLLLKAMIALALLAIVGFVMLGATSQTTEVAFQNDDYQVPPPDANPPPIPIPDTYEEAEAILTNSPFYDQTAPAPVRCNTQPINVGTASDSQLKSHFEGMMECLIRVWQPPVSAAQLTLVRPTVTIYGDKMTTKCGTSGINAFYCAADQQVYYSNRLADAIPIVAEDKWAAEVVIAHEFGHALQGRTGILISAKALGQNAGDEAADLLFTRRLETQADCLSGMFIRSVSVSLGVQNSDLKGIYATYEAIGDDVLSGDPGIVGNHGLSRTRKFWGNVGLANGAVAKCNTFIVPKNQVR